jgi:predicted nucleic acid-binding protein
MSFVLDASVTLSWCFSNEKTVVTDQLLERLADETAWVPSLWSLEIGNILISAERHKRICYAEMIQFLELLNDLCIEIDLGTSSKAFHEILTLAHSEKLTTYDAAYLELALRKGIPLASKDSALCKAAQRLGVPCLIL